MLWEDRGVSIARPQILIGLAAGDMLGAPMEFMTPEQVRKVYGEVDGPVAHSHGAFEAGEFTDDTQMALCLLAAYPADANLAARALDACREWRASGPRDIGLLTNRALSSDSVTAWIESGRKSCGNGGLMRAAASVAAGSTGDALLHEAAQLSAITHGDPRSIAACMIFCAGLESLANDAPYADAWRSALDAAAQLDVDGALQFLGAPYARETAKQWPAVVANVATFVRAGLASESAGNSGFALTTLQTAIVHGAAASFADGTLCVVREGDDSDTVAAVTGAILAARSLAPPPEWLTTLRCGERWSAWPNAAIGPACLARLESACLRAAGSL